MKSWTTKLRDWQARAEHAVLMHPTLDFLAMATPAAGKTQFALKIAHRFLSDRAADRILVVCPTNHLRTQWALAASHVGIHLDPALTNEQRQEASDYQGAVVTYQQVCLDPAVFAGVCRRRRTLIIFDEIHHAGDGKEWGMALREAFGDVVFRLSLSGTPFRSDNAPIPFVRYRDGQSQADFSYGYREAIRDGVCRPILFPSYDGDLTWLSDRGQHSHTFDEGLTGELKRERLKTALLQADWLGEVVQDAHRTLTRVRKDEQRDAGGLIVAMNQAHARSVADLVRAVTGEKAAVAVSDDPAASRIIQAFGDSGARWLVAVNMVSEGVDMPRLRVGVYATNVLTEIYFRQVVGRFVRIQAGMPRPQRAWLYLPKDPTLVEYAQQITIERDHVIEEEAPPQRTLFDVQAPHASVSGYVPLKGVARADTLISAEEPEGSGEATGEEEPSRHEHKTQLRQRHQRFVGIVARKAGVTHMQVNAELKRQTGSRIDEATVEQLKARIRILERWQERGWDGKV